MKKVRWGVIGAGGIADRRTIPGMLLSENAELYAVMEINKKLAETLKEKHHAKFAFDNTEELLALKEIDAVYISSPVFYHYEHAISSIKAKKHILIEKPIAMNVVQGEEIINLCKKNNLLIATGFMMRYHELHRQMRDIVSKGGIGQVVNVRAQFSCWYPDIEGSWRQKKALSGGGALMDLGVHCVDILQYITNSKVIEVAGFIDTKTFKYEVDDSAVVSFKMGNGASGTIEVNFNVPDNASASRLEIYGTSGSLLAEGTLGQIMGGEVKYNYAPQGGYDAMQQHNIAPVQMLKYNVSNMYEKEITSFGNSILEGKALEVPASDGIYVQKVLEGAYLSNEKKTFIKI